MPRGSDFLQLDPSRAPARGLTDWLVDAVRTAIATGQVAVGDRLPPTRDLAADLGVSRGVVVEAYQRLAEEGLTQARPRVGTVVVGVIAARREADVRGETREAARCGRPEGPDRHGAAAPPGAHVPMPWRSGYPRTRAIDLSPGVPDLATFPRAAWLRAEREVLAELTGSALGYGDPRGDGDLRSELAQWLGRTRGVRVDPRDLVVVDGVAQALAVLAHVLGRRGRHTVAVEDPGSRGGRDLLDYWGMQPRPVPVDDQGAQVAALEEVGADVVLLTPAHQFPTGVVLAPERRRALLTWLAEDGDRLLIEDDYDAEHRYDRSPVPALHASAPGQIAYTGSASKTLAPGLRLGWLVPPPELLEEVVEAKRESDLGSPVLQQRVLARLHASGHYDRHTRRARAHHRRRRDALLAGVTDRIPQAEVHGVAAGLHLLLTLPGEPGSDVALAAALSADGVVAHPLSWHQIRPGPPGLVLGYAATSPHQLRAAVERIAAAIDGDGG